MRSVLRLLSFLASNREKPRLTSSIGKGPPIVSDMRKLKTVFPALLVIACVLSPKFSFSYEDYDVIQKELNKANDFYKAGQYGMAWTQLERIREMMGMDDASREHWFRYPNSFRYAVLSLESNLTNKEGGYESYPSFTGIVKQREGNVGGNILVQGDNKEQDFLYDARLITIRNGHDLIGSKVTIYYEEAGAQETWALKVVIHE